MTSAFSPPRLIALTSSAASDIDNTQNGFSPVNWPITNNFQNNSNNNDNCSSTPPMLTNIMDESYSIDLNIDQQSKSPIDEKPEIVNSSPEISDDQMSAALKRKKSKKRRWILSRRPKCFSRPSNEMYNSSDKKKTRKSKTGNKRELTVTGNGLVNLETVVHASVFLPHKCDDTDDGGTTLVAGNGTSVAMATAYDFKKHLATMATLLPHLRNIAQSNFDVQAWSIDDVAKFVRICCPSGPEKLADRFKDELIDGEALLLLKFDDFYKQMNIKLGPSLKIYWSVDYLKHLKSNRRDF